MPEGFAELQLDFPSHCLATDCTAFDWTFPPWLVKPLLESRLERTRGVSDDYVRACHARWNEVLGTSCVVRLPDGQRLRQVVPGLMKSGWLLTISVNSEAQDLITRAAWYRSRRDDFPTLWAMGDDVLLSWDGSDPDRLVKQIRRLGILTKMAVQKREFAGFGFGEGTNVEPLYPEKHKFLLGHASLDQLEEMVSSYGLLYALAAPSWADRYITMYSRWTKRACRSWALGTLTSGIAPRQVDTFERFFGFWD